MATSVLRRVFQKRAAGFCSSAGGISISRNSCCRSNLGGHRMMSTVGSDESPPSRMLPWLMLPPDFGGDEMVYKFYSLAEKKVLSIDKRSSESESESAADDAEFVGSSHGWIALFNRRNNDLFLSNPLTRRHIKLPMIELLPDHEMNSRIGRGNVSKVILSSPPDDEGCRAMLTFGPSNRLAFCSPGRPIECDGESEYQWIPIGDLLIDLDDFEDETTAECAKVYEDLVYCKRRKVFNCMTPCEFDLQSFGYLDRRYWCSMDAWDVEKPLKNVISYIEKPLKNVSSSIIWVEKKEKEKEKGNIFLMDWVKEKMGLLQEQGNTLYWVKKKMGFLQDQCVQIPHIVYADHSDQLYLVMRFVMLMNSDGTPLPRVPVCRFRGLAGYFPSKTVGFIVFNVKEDGYSGIVDDMNGLAMFVGMNHSFALPASDFPELKPNSIYFTDAKRIERIYGRNDIGIFDYQNKTIEELISSSEIRIPDYDDPPQSSPMWFTPADIY